jgi:hypothetical protein
MRDRPAGRRRRVRRNAARGRIVLAAVLISGLAALVPPGVQLVSTWRAERSAQDTATVDAAVAEAERAALPERVARLRAAEQALRAAEQRLEQGLDGLLGSVTHRHVVRTELARVQEQLRLVGEAAAAAEVEAFIAAVSVRSLGTCLDEVSAVLNHLAVGDHAGAALAVERLAPACADPGVAA